MKYKKGQDVEYSSFAGWRKAKFVRYTTEPGHCILANALGQLFCTIGDVRSCSLEEGNPNVMFLRERSHVDPSRAGYGKAGKLNIQRAVIKDLCKEKHLDMVHLIRTAVGRTAHLMTLTNEELNKVIETGMLVPRP